MLSLTKHASVDPSTNQSPVLLHLDSFDQSEHDRKINMLGIAMNRQNVLFQWSICGWFISTRITRKKRIFYIALYFLPFFWCITLYYCLTGTPLNHNYKKRTFPLCIYICCFRWPFMVILYPHLSGTFFFTNYNIIHCFWILSLRLWVCKIFQSSMQE